MLQTLSIRQAHELAVDLYADTLIRVRSARKNFDINHRSVRLTGADLETRALAFVKAVAKYVVLDWRRAQMADSEHEIRVTGRAESASGTAIDAGDLLDHIAQAASLSACTQMPGRIEDTDMVQRILGGLSDTDRNVILLAHRDEYNMKEVAETLGLTYGAARKRLHDALKRARSVAHELGYGGQGDE